MNRLACAIAVSTIMLSGACSSRPQESVGAFAGDTREAGMDAFGLPRERPLDSVMVDGGDVTVPTPYGGEGARRVCSTVARDIARLSAVLGPDLEAAALAQAEAADDERTVRERGRELAEDAPDLARDGYRSLLVGLNPARPVIRFVGRASEIERAARTQREIALKRRAYLRGLFDGFGCGYEYMDRAMRAYNLINGETQ